MPMWKLTSLVVLVGWSGSPVSTAPLAQGHVCDDLTGATAARQGTRRVRPACCTENGPGRRRARWWCGLWAGGAPHLHPAWPEYHAPGRSSPSPEPLFQRFSARELGPEGDLFWPKFGQLLPEVRPAATRYCTCTSGFSLTSDDHLLLAPPTEGGALDASAGRLVGRTTSGSSAS